MFPRVRLCVGGAVAAVVMAVSAAANAATVNLDLLKFDRGELVDAQTAMADDMSGLQIQFRRAVRRGSPGGSWGTIRRAFSGT